MICKLMIIFIALFSGSIGIMGCEKCLKKELLPEVEPIDLNNRIEFTISTEKEKYSSSAPIYCQCSLTNTLEDSIVINRAFRLNSEATPETVREIYFDIVSPEGETMPMILLIRGRVLKREDFIILNSKMRYEHTDKYDLNKYYHLKQPGKYKITAIYENYNDGSEFGLKAWTGRVKSNTIEIEIIP